MKNLFPKDAGCWGEVSVISALVEIEGAGPLSTVHTELPDLQKYLDAQP